MRIEFSFEIIEFEVFIEYKYKFWKEFFRGRVRMNSDRVRIEVRRLVGRLLLWLRREMIGVCIRVVGVERNEWNFCGILVSFLEMGNIG